VTQSVQANAVFAILPADVTARLQERHHFYVWDHRTGEVRLMCSWDTTEAEARQRAKQVSLVKRMIDEYYPEATASAKGSAK